MHWLYPLAGYCMIKTFATIRETNIINGTSDTVKVKIPPLKYWMKIKGWRYIWTLCMAHCHSPTWWMQENNKNHTQIRSYFFYILLRYKTPSSNHSLYILLYCIVLYSTWLFQCMAPQWYCIVLYSTVLFQCMAPQWYLSCIWQLHIITPVVLIPLVL